MHVVKAPWVGRIGADRCRPTDQRQTKVHLAHVRPISPPEPRIGVRAIGELEFVNGRRPILATFLFGQPLAKRLHVHIVDARDRQVVVFEVVKVPRGPPRSAPVEIDEFSVRPLITRRLDELAIHAMGNGKFAEPVIVQLDRHRHARAIQRKRSISIAARVHHPAVPGQTRRPGIKPLPLHLDHLDAEETHKCLRLAAVCDRSLEGNCHDESNRREENNTRESEKVAHLMLHFDNQHGNGLNVLVSR